jgi:MFS family permease
MVSAALSFYLLERLPVNFGYPQFAALLVLVGIGMGLFTSPNQAGIMNSLPPNRRGAGAGMATTFQNSALVLSIGIFFTLMVLGLAGSLPGTLDQGLKAHGVAPDAAQRISQLPPVGLLFS